MLDKEKMNEIEYYSYLESIILNLDSNIDSIKLQEEKINKLNTRIKVLYILIGVLFAIYIMSLLLIIFFILPVR